MKNRPVKGPHSWKTKEFAAEKARENSVVLSRTEKYFYFFYKINGKLSLRVDFAQTFRENNK